MTAATSSLVEGLTAVFYVWKIKIDICSACSPFFYAMLFIFLIERE